MAGKYATRSEGAIKKALLALLGEKPLADVTVSELARKAHVSRSTFYEHFGNPADVYDSLVIDFAQEVSPIMSQVTCTDGFRPSGRPFCALVRDAGPLAPAVGEQRFLDAFVSQGTAEQHDLHNILVDAGYTQEQASAIAMFQLSGCFAAARASEGTDADWEETRAAIDRFILGGIAACLAAKKALTA